MCLCGSLCGGVCVWYVCMLCCVRLCGGVCVWYVYKRVLDVCIWYVCVMYDNVLRSCVCVSVTVSLSDCMCVHVGMGGGQICQLKSRYPPPRRAASAKPMNHLRIRPYLVPPQYLLSLRARSFSFALSLSRSLALSLSRSFALSLSLCDVSAST